MSTTKITINAEPLSVNNFRPYGSIVSPREQITKEIGEKQCNANQGTAIKIRKITQLQNDFNVKSTSNINIFQCFPQTIKTEEEKNTQHICKILEKHPYSSQTFIPLCGNPDKYQYLVIVSNGTDKPDFTSLKAFLCRGDQAVTYGKGTWHAPMIVINDAPITFSVLINECDIDEMDCVEYDNVQITVNL
ncbi:related to Ureidoglycolate hydrolase [Saccharomycodes ludwigii]|uniref:Related to Ureidoglycolate hydrolase n=1 Tax=Saccharomycodes ludwigii TaxID=36035 RepID=A0A376B7K0_9ASCO|nr:hypothetical protein SCDLUD_002067 [Saccharomycodes ludwigii]KAH3902250.1 hypothetical protein SCDLUD_002067 [Saccharomycodes ludwigii]SSD60667.1 related to Ureidoglycolate hydrolase [Saccharomycodes ludwigii]